MTKPYQISKQLVWKAYQQVKTNGGAGGVTVNRYRHLKQS